MTLKATALFESPQSEIASAIRDKLAASVKTQIVAGFMTPEGARLLERPISANPAAVDTIVIGAGTYQAYEAFDRLVGAGVAPEALFVHLGHTHLTGPGAKHRFYRYHPMLHSKIYYAEHADGGASAIIGSHNMTGYALTGMNGEASVLLEGPQASPEFAKIRAHIQKARSQAVPYISGMKEAFSWWTHQFMEGLADKTNDLPRDGAAKKTIVILAEARGSKTPQKGDVLYFELPSALGTIQSLRAEIHIYVFDALPASPLAGLQALRTARASLWCRTLGLEMAKGGVELRADWSIDNPTRPTISPAPTPFRPTPTSDMQQVRVEAYNEVYGDFEYLFEAPQTGWVPEVSREDVLVPKIENSLAHFEDYHKANPEHLEWYLVKSLTKRVDADSDDKYSKALKALSPESGSYIVMSLRRRERSAQ
jgi:hypothetical protein